MGVFREVGKGLGTVGGGLLGGTVKVSGKVVGTRWKRTGKWLEEVGDDVQSASKIVLETAGQFIDGAAEGAYGIIKQDQHYKQKGWNDIKDSTGRTVIGIGSTLKYTADNVGTTYKGLKRGNTDQVLDGLKNLGKVVAVSAIAIGVVDILDGADLVDAEELDSRIDSLDGDEHPVTGVTFMEKTVELPDGVGIEGTFPVFDSSFHVEIAEDYYLASDDVHFKIANDTLYQAIQENPNLANEIGLSSKDVQALSQGNTPEGFAWHHNEQPGIIQLVDQETHDQTGHTGGRSIWGGGSQNR